MPFEYIKYEIEDRIAFIRFNRPGQLNAMNAKMMDEIIEALSMVNVAPEKEVGLCVLTGEGKAFMAGADIKEYAQQSESQFKAFQTKGRSMYAAIEGNSRVVIAAINGYAFGGGLEIALACDMMVARQYAKMGLPEINLNLIPGGGGTQRLAKKLGTNLANELIMTGKTVTAEEMNEWRVINHIFEKELFMEKVKEFCMELVEKPLDRLHAIKQLTQISIGGVQTPALSMENEALARFYLSDLGQQKIQDFYKKSISKEQ